MENFTKIILKYWRYDQNYKNNVPIHKEAYAYDLTKSK